MDDPARNAARLFVFVRLHARSGRERDVAIALRTVVNASRAEPGCVTMDAFQATRDPRLFFIHSRWVDESAFDRHAELAHTRAFIERVDALLDEPRTVTRTVLIPDGSG